uniref:AbaA protein n=1 Tax=Streptomyces coelicolor TaxID=1902 RepID=Q53895_STRCH|nr:abaA [Streptomyces coelicolor]
MSAASHRISRLEPYLDRAEPAPTLLKMLVGVQLAGFREDAGLSQDQAARALGFSAAKLSRIESGKGRRLPRRPTSGRCWSTTTPIRTRPRSCSSCCNERANRAGGSGTTSA